MRITVFNGSPRTENGNTHWIVREFAAGAEEVGATVENIFLAEQDFRPCEGCFACWKRTPGTCMYTDDMAELLGKFPASDLVVFATPLYVDNVSGIMKLFMDRLIPLADPHFRKDGEGECIHPTRNATVPKIAVISNSGFPEQTHFQVLRLLFRRVARNFQSELVAEIYRGAGEMLSSKNPLLKPLLVRYAKLLQQAGREVVETGRLSEKTQESLERPLVPDGLYIKGANKHWDKELAELDQD